MSAIGKPPNRTLWIGLIVFACLIGLGVFKAPRLFDRPNVEIRVDHDGEDPAQAAALDLGDEGDLSSLGDRIRAEIAAELAKDGIVIVGLNAVSKPDGEDDSVAIEDAMESAANEAAEDAADSAKQTPLKGLGLTADQIASLTKADVFKRLQDAEKAGLAACKPLLGGLSASALADQNIVECRLKARANDDNPALLKLVYAGAQRKEFRYLEKGPGYTHNIVSVQSEKGSPQIQPAPAPKAPDAPPAPPAPPAPNQ